MKRFLHAHLLLVMGMPPVTAGAQTIEWIRQFGSAAGDQAYSIVMDETGVYVSGVVGTVLPGQTAAGGGDAFVRKYDASGNILWTRQFGSPEGDNAFAIARGSNGLYAAGRTAGAFPGLSSSGADDVFVRRLEFDGAEGWSTQFGTAGDDWARSLKADETGVFVAGHVSGALPGMVHAGAEDAYVRRYNSSGAEIWTVQFGTATVDAVTATALHSGFLYVAGATSAALPGQIAFGNQDGFLAKVATDGTLLWIRQFGTAGIDSGFDLAVDDSGIYVGGATSDVFPQQQSYGGRDTFVRKYDFNGGVVWTRQFGTSGDDFSSDVAVGTNGLYMLGRTTAALPDQTSAGGQDIFIRKYDYDGNELWTQQLGTPLTDMLGGGAVIARGRDVYVAGDTQGTLPGQVRAGGSTDAFLIKLIDSSVPALPVVSTGGVVNNASFAAHPAPLAPGSIAAVFGTGLNEGSTIPSSFFGPDGKLTTELGGASVTVNGIPAPLFYSTPFQLGIQIPLALAGQGVADVVVTVAGQSSAPQTINLDAFAPGIFTTTQQGIGRAAALHENGVSPVTGQNPARLGEVVTFFATGLGALTPPLGTGEPSSGNQTVIMPAVLIGGISAEVQFSGAAPGFVGLNQVNARVPANAPTGPDVPIVLTIGGKQSNEVTLPIAP